MKIFISQVMRGRTGEGIKEERQKATDIISKLYPDCEFIDSYIEDAPKTDGLLWWIGESLKLLSKADMCFFVNDCILSARDCCMEYEACLLYGIPWGIVYTEDIADKVAGTVEVEVAKNERTDDSQQHGW